MQPLLRCKKRHISTFASQKRVKANEGADANCICPPSFIPFCPPCKGAFNSVNWDYPKILHIKLEVHNIAVLHHVVFALLAQLACCTATSFAA